MKKVSLYFSFLLLFITNTTRAQHQDKQLLAYNVSFGAITAGIGSVINKPKSVNWKHAFLRGAWQGSAGGLINYFGKKSARWISTEKNLVSSIPAKIIHSAGNSIVENAAFYRPLFDTWSLDYTLLKFNYCRSKKEFRVRFLPAALYAIPAAARSGKFDLKESAIIGVLIFKSPYLLTVKGISYGRAIVYPAKDEYGINRFQILSHEILHTFQLQDYLIFNTWLNKPAQNIAGVKAAKIFNNYIYADIPYIYPFYQTQRNHTAQHYFSNFYEFEAERFSTNRKVMR